MAKLAVTYRVQLLRERPLPSVPDFTKQLRGGGGDRSTISDFSQLAITKVFSGNETVIMNTFIYGHFYNMDSVQDLADEIGAVIRLPNHITLGHAEFFPNPSVERNGHKKQTKSDNSSPSLPTNTSVALMSTMKRIVSWCCV